MSNTRQTMVEKYGGEEAYRQHMRDIRAKVKNHPGGSFRKKRFAKAMAQKGAAARWKAKPKTAK